MKIYQLYKKAYFQEFYKRRGIYSLGEIQKQMSKDIFGID